MICNYKLHKATVGSNTDVVSSDTSGFPLGGYRAETCGNQIPLSLDIANHDMISMFWLPKEKN